MNKCTFFGHKWKQVLISDETSFCIIACYCGRGKCYLGHGGLTHFVVRQRPSINTYNIDKYYKKTMEEL